MFDNVAGLKAGAPVRVAGVEVGSVARRAVRRRPGRSHHRNRGGASARASRPGRGRRWARCRCSAKAAVDITPVEPGHADSRMGLHSDRQAGADLRRSRRSRRRAGIEEATALLQDIRGGRGTMGQLFTDDALYRELNALVGIGRSRGHQIANGPRHARPADQRRCALPRAHAAVQDLNAITARIRNGEGSLGKLLNDPGVGQFAHGNDAEHRDGDRETEPRRRHRGEAAQRNGALRSARTA